MIHAQGQGTVYYTGNDVFLPIAGALHGRYHNSFREAYYFHPSYTLNSGETMKHDAQTAEDVPIAAPVLAQLATRSYNSPSYDALSDY